MCKRQRVRVCVCVQTMSHGGTDDVARKRALLENAALYPRITSLGLPWAVSDEAFVGTAFHGVPPHAVVDTRVYDLSRRRHDVVCMGKLEADRTLSFSFDVGPLLGGGARFTSIEFVRLDGFDVRHVRTGFAQVPSGIAALDALDAAARTCMRGTPFRADMHVRDARSTPLPSPGFQAPTTPKPSFVAVQGRQAVEFVVADPMAVGHTVFRSPYPVNSALHLLVAALGRAGHDSTSNLADLITRHVRGATDKECHTTPAIGADREAAVRAAQSVQLFRCLSLAAFLAAFVPRSYVSDHKGTPVTDNVISDDSFIRATRTALQSIQGDGGGGDADAARAYKASLDDLQDRLKSMPPDSMLRTATTGATWLLESTTLLASSATAVDVRLEARGVLGDILRIQLVAAQSQGIELVFPARFTVITRDVTMT